MLARFSTVASEFGTVQAEHDVRDFTLKFYSEDSNWNPVGNNPKKSQEFYTEQLEENYRTRSERKKNGRKD